MPSQKNRGARIELPKKLEAILFSKTPSARISLSTETKNSEEKLTPADAHNTNSGQGLAVEERWLVLPDGRMRYLKAGSGRPLILIHGLMGYAFSWRFTFPALAPH